jgi:hypothetical protein
MGAGLLTVKSGFILFIKSYQFPLQINTLERERVYTGFLVELEHLTIETKLIDVMFVSVMGEYVFWK